MLFKLSIWNRRSYWSERTQKPKRADIGIVSVVGRFCVADGLAIYLLLTLSLSLSLGWSASAAAFDLPNFSGRGQDVRYGQFWCRFKFDLRRSFWKEFRKVPDGRADQSNLHSNGKSYHVIFLLLYFYSSVILHIWCMAVLDYIVLDCD